MLGVWCLDARSSFRDDDRVALGIASTPSADQSTQLTLGVYAARDPSTGLNPACQDRNVCSSVSFSTATRTVKHDELVFEQKILRDHRFAAHGTTQLRSRDGEIEQGEQKVFLPNLFLLSRLRFADALCERPFGVRNHRLERLGV